MSGLFIVIEGPDGAGKSTLARELARRLRVVGVEPVEAREPGGTPVAEAARAVFLDPALHVGPVSELFLVLAARADLVATVIRPALDAGRVVLCERYDYSTEAYQIVGRGLDPEAVRAANGLASGGLRPNLTVVLDITAAAGEARQRREGKQPDRLELADRDLHERVVRYFQTLSGPEVTHVDGSRPPDAVAERAWAVVASRLGETIGVGRGLK